MFSGSSCGGVHTTLRLYIQKAMEMTRQLTRADSAKKSPLCCMWCVGKICCRINNAITSSVAETAAHLHFRVCRIKASAAARHGGHRISMGSTVRSGLLKWLSKTFSSGPYQHSTKMASSAHTGSPVSSVCDGDIFLLDGPPRSRNGLLAASSTSGHCWPTPSPKGAINVKALSWPSSHSTHTRTFKMEPW